MRGMDGVTWPKLPGMDYRHGFPMLPVSADLVDEIGIDVEREEMLARLERATFEALVEGDIEMVDSWLAMRDLAA